MSKQLKWNIIKHFSSKKRFGFKTKDVASEFPEKYGGQLNRVLAQMIEEGMLCKLARDHYHIIPATENPDTYIPDSHQVAKYIMQDKEYYIGYASAMRIHKLAFQPTLNLAKLNNAKQYKTKLNAAKDNEPKLNEFVVTKDQMKPAIRIFLGIPYQFVRQDTIRFFGSSSIWINQHEKALVSDLEKTIVDMTANPQYCGGIIKVAQAIFQAEDRTIHDKLFYYFARYQVKSAKKRFLFLIDLLGLEWTEDHERMMEELGSGTTLLDPGATNRGRSSKKFRMIINVDPNHIKKKVEG